LNLPEETARSLAALGNLGVSKTTWSTYRTAKVMLAKCETETRSDLSLPFNERKTLIFVDWLVRVRNLRGATVNLYLSGVRQLHIVSNFDASVVDVFHSDGDICPVKAFLTWSKLRLRNQNEPLFRFDNGTPLTGTRMNRLIDQLLNPYVDKT
jgi:hypothetical protein